MQACLILFSSLSLGIEIRQAHLCSRSCVSCNFPRRRLISRVNSCSFSKKRIALSVGTAVCFQEKGCSSLCKGLSVFPVSSIQLSIQAYSLAISGEISPETFSMQLHFCPLAGFRGTPIAPLVWIDGNISGGGRFLANLPASFEWTFVHNNVVIVLKTNCHSQFSILNYKNLPGQKCNCKEAQNYKSVPTLVTTCTASGTCI